MNHLKNEKSPYLKQHANNPVDWYPWSKKPFVKAKNDNKPIFLSIGYSTCHWCHVMAHESFEDKQVAKLINDNFVSVKVDREERPDIDKIYMNVCQMITGSGGWPLTIIMTPDKKPFFAATYIPKDSRYGIKGLITLLPEINTLWKNKRNELNNSADSITSALQKITLYKEKKELTQKTITNAYEQLLNSYDEINGGFGNKPKFPTPHNLLFLLRYWRKTNNKFSLNMVISTLKQMRRGGIFDQIGFGFHRYSTDRKWILPHFEKMLYDQALLLLVYTEAYQITEESFFKKTAEEIIEYVLRDMKSREGGFYSAEDADSEGEEGKFYTWNYDELNQIVTPEEMDIITKIYNIKKEGNFLPEVGKIINENIFYQILSIEDYAKFYKINEEDIFKKLDGIRKKLFKIRKNRIHPEKDDKILTDWNGLMIAALSKAGRVFNNKYYVKKAEEAANFILNDMTKDNGELLHRYRRCEAKISGYADDYAFMIWGLIELYQATFDIRYLHSAKNLNTYLIDHFWDKDNGGFYFTSDKNEEILTRIKETYDGAIPSANSVSVYNLAVLSRITGDINLEDKARQIIKTFSDQINNMPSGYTQMLIGLDFLFGPSFEIIIVGNKGKKDTQKIIQSINSIYQPNRVVLLKDPDSIDLSLTKLVPYSSEYSQIKNQATIYVCRNQKCQLPTTSIDEMKKFLIENN